MEKLYKFSVNCGRMGTLSGVFVAEEEKVQTIMGEKAYFGEVLGKHSDITVKIDDTVLTVLTDDHEFIKKAEEYKLVPIGHNPLDYM